MVFFTFTQAQHDPARQSLTPRYKKRQFPIRITPLSLMFHDTIEQGNGILQAPAYPYIGFHTACHE